MLNNVAIGLSSCHAAVIATQAAEERLVPCIGIPMPSPARANGLPDYGEQDTGVSRDRTTTVEEIEAHSGNWVVKTLPRLREVASLPDNWDGRGSPRTSGRIVGAAYRLLARLQHDLRSVLPPPFVCPISGGAFQLEWTSDRKHLEIEFIDEHRIAFVLEELGTPEESITSGEYSAANAAKTRHLLEWFAEA